MHFRSIKRPQLIPQKHGQRRRQSSLSARRHDSLSGSEPLTWPSTPCPSPHEILGAKRGAPYSKSRFYRLVKLYHPDLAHDGPGAVSRATRAERYRLVVGANELLSCPERRRRYEQHGVGWVFPSTSPAHASRAWKPTRQTDDDFRRWSHGWEQSTTGQQVPLFASNAAVAMMLVALAFAGAIVQLERARRAQWTLRLGDAALQDAIARDLEGVAQRLEGKPRELRILEFLARREFGVLRECGDGALPGDPGDNLCRH